MNIALGLALGAMFFGALADLMYKVAQNKGINAATFVLYQSLTFGIIIWAFGLIFGQLSGIIPSIWLFGPPIGVLSYLGIVLFVMSLKDGNVSVNAPIFGLNFVITSVMAVLILGEPVSLPKITGILLAVAAIVSLADLTSLRTTRTMAKSLAFVLLAAVFFGIAGVFIKEGTNQGHETIPLVMTSTVGFVSSALLYTLITRQLRPNHITIRLAPLVGVLQLSFTLLLFQALQTGDVSVIYPISQLARVLAAVLGVLFLKELIKPRLIVGLGALTFSVIAFIFV